MIITIKEWKKFNENILVPRNIEGRKEKFRQERIRLLSHEIIEGDLLIDTSFEGIPEELVKVKEIKGSVKFHIDIKSIPSWFKNIKIYDDFSILLCFMYSLENCPQYIGGSFNCSFNSIKSLEGGPQYVGEDYKFNFTDVDDGKYLAKYIGGDVYHPLNFDKNTIPNDVKIKGKLKI